jgi:hypothetical protein
MFTSSARKQSSPPFAETPPIEMTFRFATEDLLDKSVLAVAPGLGTAEKAPSKQFVAFRHTMIIIFA